MLKSLIKITFPFIIKLMLVLGSVFFIYSIGGAQQHLLNLKFKGLTTVDGLSGQRHNSFIKKDSKKNVWISSLEGVNKFNGTEVTAYTSANSNLPKDWIQSNFYEDQAANIWFTTQRYLVKYDPVQDDFFSYQLHHQNDFLDSLDYHIFHIQPEKNTLWLKIGKQILTANTLEPNQLDTLPNTTSGIRFLVNQNSEGEVNRILAWYIQNPGLEIWTKLVDGTWKKELLWNSVNEKDSSLFITEAIIENDTSIWLLTKEQLIRFNPYTNCLKMIPTDKQISYGTSIGSHYLLLSSRTEGLWLYDTQQQRFIDNWKATNEEYSLATDHPKCIYFDGSIVWVEHRNAGVNYAPLLFHSFRNPFEEKGITPEVTSIVEDQEQCIWVATRQDGVFQFDITGRLLKTFAYEDQNIKNKDFININHLSTTLTGAVWALKDNHIFRYTKETGWKKAYSQNGIKWQSFYHLSDLSRKILISNRGINDLVELKPNTYQVNKSPEFEAFKEFDFQQIFKIANKRFLIPFQSRQLWVYTERNKKLIQDTIIDINSHLFGMAESVTKDTIFMGTSNGLLVLPLKGMTAFQPQYMYNDNWDLGAQPIYQIQLDAQRQLWMSSDNGIWRLSPDGMLRQFSKIDGLISDNFDFNASLKDSEGKIWMGNVKGLTVFDPTTVDYYQGNSKIKLKELYINNERKENIEDYYSSEKEQINLKWNENNFSINPQIVGNFSPSVSKISTQLKGYSEQWTILNKGERINYDQVPSGRYNLIIRAKSGNGIQEKVEISLEIEMHFLQKIWVRVSLFSLLIFIIYGFAKIYVSIKLREQKDIQEKEKLLKDERERIGRELHDYLGTNLSEIQFTAEILMDMEEENEKLEEITSIYKYASESLVNMQDIVWILKTQSDTLQNLLSYIRRKNSNYFAKHNIRFTMNVADALPDMELGYIVRKNLLLIFVESLHNIVKHANATEVICDVAFANNTFNFCINDNGKGFEIATTAKKMGNGLSNLHKRAADLGGDLHISSSLAAGTCIELQLPLPKKITKLNYSITKIISSLWENLLNLFRK